MVIVHYNTCKSSHSLAQLEQVWMVSCPLEQVQPLVISNSSKTPPRVGLGSCNQTLRVYDGELEYLMESGSH